MNAKELADWLQDNAIEMPADWESGEPINNMTIAANMLRQQADRIAELEKDGKVCATCGGLVYDPVLKQTKPVAWMQMHYKDNIPTKFSPVKVWEDDIPLYTTPQTKPLSHEEIHELANQHLRTQDHDGSKVVTGLEDFARAIEERHGIK